MARIVYKEGLEGQNRLECIEGIEIDLLNGQKALIYPKYAVRKMLSPEQIDKWDAKELTEIRALKVENTAKDTRELLSIGSPAAEWVNQFHSDEHDTKFYLPSLLAAMEIQDQELDIDGLAKTIEGADLLRFFTSCIWSCFRQGENNGWSVYGYSGYINYGSLYGSHLAVPIILL